MGMFDFFKKGFLNQGKITNRQISELIKFGCVQGVSDNEAYNLYRLNSDLGLAVDMIATEFSSIVPIIVDENGEVVDKVHPAIQEFFKNPNSVDSYSEFALNVASNFLLHRNAFIYVDGLITQAPKSIFNIPNDKINLNEQSNQLNYTLTTSGIYTFMNDNYVMKITGEKSDILGRIINKTNLKEIYQVRGFYQTSQTLKSPSYVSSIKRNLDVIDQALVKLVAEFTNGFAGGGLISVSTEDQEAYEQFVKDFRTYYEGSNNASKTLLVKGEKVKYDPTSKSNHDMQVVDNKKDSKNSVYQRFGIPQPLIDQQSQTYNNYQTALFSLYTNSVLPVAEMIFDTYTEIFQDRKSGNAPILPENQKITFDENSIPALQLRKNEELKILKDVGVLTINEIRARAGYESIQGGDVLYQPATLLPVGSDQFTEDNLEKPKKKFYEDLEGSGFKKEQIDEYWNEYKAIIKGD